MMISIIGDSISTFESFNPEGYSVFYDSQMQYINELSSSEDTWWAQVIRALHGDLCVNDSYSGSKVSGKYFPSACCEERCGNLHTAQHNPDVILIYIGFNDFGSGASVNGNRFTLKHPDFFADAYDCMLNRLSKNYPCAKIIYATLMRTYIKDSDWTFPERNAGVRFDDYNNAIRNVGQKENCYLADLNLLNLRYETKDGSHPTKLGHTILADAWIRSLDQLGAFTWV